MPDNAVATQPAANPIAQFRGQLEARAADIQMALPAHISPDKFQRTVMTAVSQNPELLKADRQSLVLACYKAAQDALLPDGREAALVPFKQSYKDGNEWKSRLLVQYMPMVYGLRKKILQSSEVVSLEVGIVYRAELEGGKFLYEVGLTPPLRHRPSFDLDEKQTADEQIIAAYSIATMADGSKSYEVMRRFEIDKVRESSQTGATKDKFGKTRKPSGPWVEWFPEQAKKTVMRRHSKVLPQSGDVIIDVEGHELDRNVSTAALLGSTTPDEPQAIADQSAGTFVDETDGSTVDSGTGEVVNEAQPEQAEKTPAKAKAAKKAEPKPAEPAGATDQPTSEGGALFSDEETASQHHTAPLAEKLLEAFAGASTVAELEKAYADGKADIETMSDHLADSVYGAYNRNLGRLRKAEPVSAK